MDFDLTWALWSLPLVFGAGWWASRVDLKQGRIDHRNAPKAYYKGLNHLLNGEQDAAIDVFISAVQHDADTTELHFALGSLFRRRGDYDRAVRVHEHLLQRADLSPKDHSKARYALGQDFIKAGLLDRAEIHLQQLIDTAYAAQALILLLGLYERTREWDKATAVARQLESQGEGQFRSRITHHRCEQAQAWRASAQASEEAHAAEHRLREAWAADPDTPRVRLELAELLIHTHRPAEAWQVLHTLAAPPQPMYPLALPMLLALAPPLGHTAELQQWLHAAQHQAPSVDYTNALAQLSLSSTEQQQHQLQHLHQEPHSLLAAQAWLVAHSHTQPLPTAVLQALEHACVPLRRYRCSACGFEASRHFWQCPGCQSWDSYSPHRVEEL